MHLGILRDMVMEDEFEYTPNRDKPQLLVEGFGLQVYTNHSRINISINTQISKSSRMWKIVKSV